MSEPPREVQLEIGVNADDSLGTNLPTVGGPAGATHELGSARPWFHISAVPLRKAMDDSLDTQVQNVSESPADGRNTPRPTVSRRDLFRLTFGGGAGLALGGLLDVPAMRAATKDLKLSEVSEFTTSCNFCSCGCGMIAAVKDGKLVKMEGDYDHIVNRGSLCVKGISMFATHASPQRLTTPRYRAPGSDKWQDISWDEAITKVAQKVRKTRDETWIATEKVNTPQLSVDIAAADRTQNIPRFLPQDAAHEHVPVNRTDAIGFLGGAQNTNEECYLFQKAARLLGLPYVEHQARL